MPTKFVITYREVQSTIMSPVTKFGGLPVWLEEPRWPLSRLYGNPMQFICQIALDPLLFGDLPARMAYLFLTDWDYESPFPETFDPDAGESALIVQPGGTWSGPSLPLYDGPSLYRRFFHNGRWEQASCEFAVDLRREEDVESGTWDHFPEGKEARDVYWAALLEDKLGGTPVPTPFGPRFGADFDGWRLILQLNTKDNAPEVGDPFFINFADDGVGYAFLSPDGHSGRFLWSR